MKLYRNVKFISKIMIALSVLCCVFSLGIYFLNANRFSADSADSAEGMEEIDEESTATLTIEKSGDNVVAFKICDDSFKDSAFENNRVKGSLTEGGAEYDDLEPELNYDGDRCYRLENQNSYITVKAESASYKIIEYALDTVSEADKSDLLIITGRYMSQLLREKPDFQITSNSATLLHSESIKDLKDQSLTNNDNVEFAPNATNPTGITIKLFTDSSRYTNPADPSVWLTTKDAIVNLIETKWGNYGIDFSDELKYLEDAEQAYTYSLNFTIDSQEKTVNGVKFSFDFPKEIDMDKPDLSPQFKIKIDTSGNPGAFVDPEKPYVKIYVKPLAQKDVEGSLAAKVCSTTNGVSVDAGGGFSAKEINFNWSAIKSQMERLRADNAGLSIEDYSPDIARKYYINVVVNNKPSGTTVASLDAQFTATTLESNATPNYSDVGKRLFIFNVPSQVKQNSTAKITLKVLTGNMNGKSVDKIVLYACNFFDVSGSTENCSMPDGSDAVKHVWLSNSQDFYNNFLVPRGTSDRTRQKYESGEWSKYQLNKTMEYQWNTQGLSPGTRKIIMVKAFTRNPSALNPDDPFVDIGDTRSTAEIKVASGSSVEQISRYSNRRNRSSIGVGFGFGNLASDNPHGSSISSITELVSRFSIIVSTVIGSIAFLVFLIAGFIYMGAGSDDKKLNQAKKAMAYAIIGLVVAVLSYAILRIYISNILNSLKLPSIESIMKIK